MIETPRLLLGTQSLLGITRSSRDRLLQIATRFQEPESLAVTFSRALKLGADGVLASPSRALGLALAELKEDVPLYALLPNVPEYLRDSSDLGMVGAFRKRAARARLGARLRYAWAGLTQASALSRADFATLIPLLLEFEMSWLSARAPRGIVVAAPITDLALAGGHRRFFERTTDFIQRRFRVTAAFETHNLGHLLASLRTWEIKPDFVIGPLNKRGLMMKPDPETVLAEVAKAAVPVLAKELRAGATVALAEAGRYALEKGAAGLVPDLVDLDDLAREFGELNLKGAALAS